MQHLEMTQVSTAAQRWYLVNNMDEIFEGLKALAPDITVLQGEPMKDHSTFKVGGPADFFVTAGSPESLLKVIDFAKEKKLPLLVLGNGSNILVKDKGIRGIVVSMPGARKFAELSVNGNVITAGAGVMLATLAAKAAEAGLSGLEFAGGIPGSLGGGVYMNAGAYGGALSDVIKTITVIDPEGNIKTLDAADCHMAYRDTRFMKTGEIICGATFELAAGNTDEIRARMKELNEQRRAKQPLEYPSAGSTFKRPEGYFAGKLIEDAGLKGYSVGGAQVSEKHAGFIINKGGAAAADILSLIEYVQEKVYAENGVRLEPEVRILGE